MRDALSVTPSTQITSGHPTGGNRPALTADAVAEGVWAATADTHDAAGSMGAMVNSVSDLALESTAKSAADNAAMAAALSA